MRLSCFVHSVPVARISPTTSRYIHFPEAPQPWRRNLSHFRSSPSLSLLTVRIWIIVCSTFIWFKLRSVSLLACASPIPVILPPSEGITLFKDVIAVSHLFVFCKFLNEKTCSVMLCSRLTFWDANLLYFWSCMKPPLSWCETKTQDLSQKPPYPSMILAMLWKHVYVVMDAFEFF